MSLEADERTLDVGLREIMQDSVKDAEICNSLMLSDIQCKFTLVICLKSRRLVQWNPNLVNCKTVNNLGLVNDLETTISQL